MAARLIGILLLGIGLIGVVLSVVGAVVGWQVMDRIELGLERNLGPVADSLETVRETLLLTKATLRDVNQGLKTAEATTLEASRTISQTGPLLEQISQITSQEVPNNIDTIQTTLADVAQVAQTVDRTLTALNDLTIQEPALGLQFNLDLGVEYEPAQPLDESINDVGTGLEELADQFRNLEGDLEVTGQNIETIGQDVAAIGAELQVTNSHLAEFTPLLDRYLDHADQLSQSVEQMQANLQGQLSAVKLGLMVIMVWIGLAQVVPLYLGWELVRGRRFGPDHIPEV